MLLYNGSPFTISESEKEFSTPSATIVPTDAKPKPTTDNVPEPAAIREPEPTMSDQVCEPTTLSVIEGKLVEYKVMEWSLVPSAKVDVDSTSD